MIQLKKSIGRMIHARRRNPVVARFARLCGNIYHSSEHPGHDVRTNGEGECLARSIDSESPVIFDVGANHGAWSAMAREFYPQAAIHAFELSPKTAVPLQQRFAGDPKVTIHVYGLSATSGPVQFFAYAGEADVLTSLRSPLHSHEPHEIQTGTVRTGAEVCAELAVERIDYLKIDAEGMDYEVIAGFGKMIDEQRVQTIQFEHQGGRYLRDFYDLLRPKGYVIGKQYGTYVDFREHTKEHEHFLGPNYIAVPESRQALIKRLQAGW